MCGGWPFDRPVDRLIELRKKLQPLVAAILRGMQCE